MSTSRPPRVLVLVLPHVHLLDLAGPVQAFWEAAGFGAGYELGYVGVQREARSGQGLLLADLSPLPKPEPSDLVLVPGIRSDTLDRIPGEPLTWLRSAHACGARLASVCSGAFVLGRAGLLDGRTCTTHWKVAERLQRENPRARVVQNRLFVKAGRLITSAGVASGIDMALHPTVHRVQDWLVAHPEKRRTLDDLGRMAGMSPRHLSRVFREATGITPLEFAHRVKLELGRDLLRSPELKVEAVADRCGFGDARQLRRLWRATYGASVSEWRRLARGA
jgi:transcriptional regulator GlxA family with amidase domain